MKISEITSEFLIDYLKAEPEDADTELIPAIMSAAKSYISGQTGIPVSAEEEGAETLDSFEDLTIAFLVLCQDMYDNRTMIPDTKYANSSNKTVESILGLHPRILI